MKQIRSWMQEKARENGERLQAFCEAFKNADGAKVEEIFTEYLNETVSIRDTAVRKDLKENFYHGFLLGLLRSREDWRVFSNKESGEGYARQLYADGMQSVLKCGIACYVKSCKAVFEE